MKSLLILILLGMNPTCIRAEADRQQVHSLELADSPELYRQINPYIYGFGTYFHENREQEDIWSLRPSAYRFGGNTSTRFNHTINAWNTGSDWYFRNIPASRDGVVDHFMEQNRKHGISSVITLPMMGWVAKDRTSHSFPRQRFPKQQDFERDAGNGIGPDQKHLKTDPHLTSIRIGPEFVADWVMKLKRQFGSHPRIYIMDNEPMLWHQNHRDIRHQNPVSYQEYLDKYLRYAKAVRRADPEAIIVGPALWGWLAWQQSAFDHAGVWNDGKAMTDRRKHNNLPFLEWFLKEVVKEEKKFGHSLIDWVDVHYYPQTDGSKFGEPHEPAFRRQLIKSTRSLWDKNYKDRSWINDKMYFIPRLKALAQSIKPELKVAIGEYNFRAERDISGAITQAEVLGIFAREGLDAAFYWDRPIPGGTHRYAFKLFRNYDGNGLGFGELWVPNNIEIKDEVSVFSAREGKRLTIVSLNKSVDQAQSFQLRLKNLGEIKEIRHFYVHSPDFAGQMSLAEQKLETKDAKLPWQLAPLSMAMTEIVLK